MELLKEARARRSAPSLASALQPESLVFGVSSGTQLGAASRSGAELIVTPSSADAEYRGGVRDGGQRARRSS